VPAHPVGDHVEPDLIVDEECVLVTLADATDMRNSSCTYHEKASIPDKRPP
jgi:hypothetical protein